MARKMKHVAGLFLQAHGHCHASLQCVASREGDGKKTWMGVKESDGERVMSRRWL